MPGSTLPIESLLGASRRKICRGGKGKTHLQLLKFLLGLFVAVVLVRMVLERQHFIFRRDLLDLIL